jgi:flagellar basal-body rod protein FlgG
MRPAMRDPVLILSAIVLTAGGVFALSRWQNWTGTNVPSVSMAATDELAFGGADSADRTPPPLLDDIHRVAAPGDFTPEFTGGAIHAEAEDVTLPAPANTAPPATLPQTTEAIPIDIRADDAARQLDELIAAELPDHAPEDHQVWREVLKGLSLDEAREILGIWKLSAGGAPPSANQRLPTFGPGPTPPTPLATSPSASDPHWQHELQLLRENLRHAQVPGYRHRELTGAWNVSTAASLPAAAAVLDLTPGEVRDTHNPLHLAISGSGFFVLRRGDELAYTRGGNFDLTNDRQLAQITPDGTWLLEPAITIPADAVAIHIDNQGTVTAARDGSQPVETCGRIELAICVNPQRLLPLSGALLQPNAASGTMSSRSPDGVSLSIRQGCLELSNVSVLREHQRLQELQAAWQLLEHAQRLAGDRPTAVH